MWTRQMLKANGKIAFKRNWLTCVLVCAVATLLGGEVFGGSTINFNQNSQTTQVQWAQMQNMTNEQLEALAMEMMTYMLMTLVALVIALIIQTVVGNIITVGCRRYFMENREHKTEVNTLFWAFSNGRYKNVLWVMFLRGLKLALWFILFVIPGIIKHYEYLMVPYLLAENPQMEQRRAFDLSREMMHGHKMEAFELEISFLGWELLGVLCTWGILNVAYVAPYMSASHAEFYAAIKAEAFYKGLTSRTELPGVDNRIVDVDVQENV